jgi:hypothetical protein
MGVLVVDGPSSLLLERRRVPIDIGTLVEFAL